MCESGCRLCGSKAELRSSHIIPRFAIQWLKDTTPTGYIRGHQVNRRLQDARTVPLLCESCEQACSRNERIFAERVFRPYLYESCREFDYGEWLLRFAVSLAWRTVAAGPRLSDDHPLEQQTALARAMRAWKRYVLNQSPNPGPYSHHMFLGNEVNFGDDPPPEGFYSYLLRSCDTTLIVGDRDLLSYTKLGPILFASYIIPAKPVGWHGTKLSLTGRITQKQTLANDGFTSFLARRRDEAMADRQISDRQVERMRRDLLKNREQALSSDSYRAFLLEEMAARERKRQGERDR